ncbi:sodium-independent sulfate anion transporter-like isoform X2 [Daphnia pulex]|uniref:sodium-independent sulfate anion transporter-like isoform X2 n=1 Tax=Daphnia pulex TaxID=6669 RepID=UPI001EDD0DF0|nr:sodium-independent sulfate anion transporter-like isoform X2 [Daphnia pulex]XP_046455002.1 sodium-independent sulfate anion transporter-like isoform X2 [Daphnia pulex]
MVVINDDVFPHHLENDANGSDDGSESDLGSISQVKQWIRGSCTTELLKRRLPFLQWAPTYTFRSIFHDCIAGFTVALTAIPQGIAYGAVAGLPVEYGLYTAFAGPFVYALLGSVRQITVGPTAVMAIMTHEYTLKGGAPYAIVLSFLAGCIELMAGLLNLGWIMDFISGPVISGFCSAAAVTVIVAQFKTLLGLKFPGSSFAKVFPGIFANWMDISLWDTVLGFSFILLLLLLKNLTLLRKTCTNWSCLRNRHVSKAIWFVSTCRNALAVILGCVIAYSFELYGYHPFNLTGEIKSGVPSFHLPPFSFERPVSNSSNSSNPEFELVTFDTILSDLGMGLAMVPIIAILEQVAIAKAFSNGGKTDSTQEMIAVGMGSIFCSFFGCLPLTASFSRSSVMSASGAKTQFANFFNGFVILIALSFLMPTFYYIPKSVLGAVIIVAVYSMVEFDEILPMWRGRRIELIPFATTFFCCLLINIEYGILAGALIHLLLLAHEATRTKSSYIRYKQGVGERIILRADRNLYFPTVERFRQALGRIASDNPNESTPRSIVIDMSRVSQVDHTSLKMLKAMLSVWDKKGERYSFANVSQDLERNMLAVLPAGINILRVRTETDSADSDENAEEAGALLAVSTCAKDGGQRA